MKRKGMKQMLAAVTAAAVFAAPCVGVSAAEGGGNYWFLQGYGDGQLHLDQLLTRAEFAKMAAEAFGLENEAEQTFTDLDASHWSYPYVMRVVKAGAISGYSDGSFRPDDLVTFEEGAKIAGGLIMNSWNLELAKGVATAIEYGITDGIDARIGEDITRGEAAQMIANALSVKEQTASYWTSGVTVGGGAEGGENSAQTGSDEVLGFNVDGNRNYDSGNTNDGTEYFGGVGNQLPVVSDVKEDNGVLGGERFVDAGENSVSAIPVGTDVVSGNIFRRYVLNGQVPEKDAVRSEELINYFDYTYPEPEEGAAFGVMAEADICPWNGENQLVRVAVQGREAEEEQSNNLVFLIDISGSMYSGKKLPVLKEAMKAMAETLDADDYLSIVTYSNGARVVLDAANGAEKEKIYTAIDGLDMSGGKTSDALTMAYHQIEKHMVDGNNRLVVCSDGDFSVALSDGQLKSMIRQGNNRGIYATALGLDMNNYRDANVEAFAANGRGTYAYIDNLKEAKRVLTEEITRPISPLAEDVRLHVTFNPQKVAEYRLIGYENPAAEAQGKKDNQQYTERLRAGEKVTALYEIVPAKGGAESADGDDVLVDVKVQYTNPENNEETAVSYALEDAMTGEVSSDFYFTAALAELGMLLNASEYAGSSSYEEVLALAQQGCGEDALKSEFIQLVDLLEYVMPE